jgi:hypothetical protein
VELIVSQGTVILVQFKHGVPLLQYLHAQVDEGVAKEVVLPEEQRFRSAPRVYW